MVTVLMATYNGEKYVSRQLDSILGQTYPGVRVIISDDLSTDRTLEIISKYAQRFPDRVTLLTTVSRQGGAAANFFRLLRAAKDEYVMLSDQDDVWLPDKVRLTLRRMKKMEDRHGSQMPILVHADLSVTDEALRVLHPSFAAYQKIAVGDNRLNHYLVENNITGSTVMINRAFLDFFEYIPEECVMHDWWMGLLASSMGKISYINQPLVLYRQHSRNELGAQKESRALRLFCRFGAGDAVRENYRKMFRQAQLLLSHYQDRLGVQQIELLAHFVRMPAMSRAGRIQTVCKYQLTKSTLVRTLGQMFTI